MENTRPPFRPSRVDYTGAADLLAQVGADAAGIFACGIAQGDGPAVAGLAALTGFRVPLASRQVRDLGAALPSLRVKP